MQAKPINHDVAHPINDPEVIKNASALNEIIRYRGITLPDLSEKCGIPAEEIHDYTVTSLDLREIRAIDLMNLAEALDADPFVLVGKKSIEDFHNKVQDEQKLDKASLDFLREMLSRPI